MSFTRTNSGLSNLALFYGVDFIVFTEGGVNSTSFEEVCNGQFNNQSVDIKFWDSVLKKHKLNKNVEFRAIGSKASSEKICGLIESNKVKNILVARDSDLDSFTGRKYESPYILYTQGYSWENDVFCPALVKQQIVSFLLTVKIPQDIEELVDKCYSNFNRHATRLLKIELIFRKHGIRLITECNGDRFIDRRSTPKLKIDQVLEIVSQRKNELSIPVKLYYSGINLSSSVWFTYGKLRESIAIAIITYVCKKVTKITSFPKDILIATMIERYANRIINDEDHYYKAQIDRLMMV